MSLLGRVHSFFVNADAPSHDFEGVFLRVVARVPKRYHQMHIVYPAGLWQGALLEVANKSFQLVIGRNHPLSLAQNTPAGGRKLPPATKKNPELGKDGDGAAALTRMGRSGQHDNAARRSDHEITKCTKERETR